MDARLGAGAAGVVLAGVDLLDPTREVALKLLHPELADDERLHKRFAREARVLRSLDHPHIVRVSDHGTYHPPTVPTTALPYFVMNRLRGESLRSASRRERARFGPAASVWQHIAAGLDAAHAHGVLHGDLKPDNVVLSPTGAQLVDFGSAKVHGLPRLTATGDVAGTPLYMAPEVLMGDRELDARADVYAFGVVVYETLAGAPPFDARHPGRLVQSIVSGDAAPLSSQGWSARVSEAVARAMAPDVVDRYASAREFAAELADA